LWARRTVENYAQISAIRYLSRKTIRKSVNMSQAVFARSFQLSLDTLKGWEQGKRKANAAAANFLRMIKADPDFVQRTLAA
jgi:putative transcriptional regulator